MDINEFAYIIEDDDKKTIISKTCPNEIIFDDGTKVFKNVLRVVLNSNKNKEETNACVHIFKVDDGLPSSYTVSFTIPKQLSDIQFILLSERFKIIKIK